MPQPATNSKQSSYLAKGLDSLHQFVATIILHKKALEFLQEQKPWKGIGKLGWALWVMLGAAALLSFQFFREIVHTFKTVQESHLSMSASLASFISFEKIAWISQGSRKYLVMIVLELVVFYTIQKTLQIRTGRTPKLTTNDFIGAEVRIVKSTVLAWVLETISRFLVVNLALGILGVDWLKQPVGFLIQCYFLGFAMVDNYHECFDLKVSQSEKRTRRMVSGVAIATGMVTFLLMHVPLVGAFAATLVSGVAATLAMERFAPISEIEHILLVAEQQKKKRKTPRSSNADG